MPISSLTIVQTARRGKGEAFPRHNGQEMAATALATTCGPRSIFLDDVEASVRASLFGEYPLGNEGFFVTIPAAYCTQVPTATINGLLHGLISSLHRYELRTDKRPKRRLVRGTRETLRHLRQGHVKLLVVAIDIDSRAMEQTDGVRMLLREANSHVVPVVFGMRRVEMTAALGRPPHIETSILGVLNADGAYLAYQELVNWTLEATPRWTTAALRMILNRLEVNPESNIIHTLIYNGHHQILEPMVRAEETKSILERSLNAVDKTDGRTPLMMAIILGEVGMAKLLLDMGADVLQRDFSLETAAHHVARSGSLELARLLLAAAPLSLECLDKKNASGLLPIHLAVATGSLPCVDYILKSMEGRHQLDLPRCLRCVMTSSHQDDEIFCLFLARSPELPHSEWIDLVALCAKSNALQCMRQLLIHLKAEFGPEGAREILDHKISSETGTPAWLAAYLGNVAIARELINHGASPNHANLVSGQSISIGFLLDKWKMAARSQSQPANEQL